MFNFKKEEKQNSQMPIADNKIDTGNVTIHTMQDDLDVLEGKKPQLESGSPIGANSGSKFEQGSNSFFSSNRKAANMAGNTSPFLNGVNPSSSQASPRGDDLESETHKNPLGKPRKDIDDVLGKNPSPPQTEKKSALGKVFFIAAIIIVVIAFAFGGYYFWTTRVSNEQAPASNEAEIITDQALTPETASETATELPTEIVQSKYSQNNPNYLPIDIGTTTANSVSKLFIEKSSEIKNSNPTAPVEFIVTDTNNDPVSFSAFNYISGMKLPVGILTSLGDKFSLYFFNDNGNMRMGLLAELKDKDKVISGMKNEEKSLADDLSSIFMGAIVKSTGKAFSDSAYNNFSIRYSNLDAQGLTSVDYTVTDKYLVIGTSKQTLRAVLDKISK
jgi:flagellar basal body-associated protein FliL